MQDKLFDRKQRPTVHLGTESMYRHIAECIPQRSRGYP